MARISQKRLLVKIARMYYERDMTQARIAARLDISRYRVQRLLKKCRRTGVVHILIVPSAGEFPQLERALEERYGLKDAVVVETPSQSNVLAMRRALGAAAAEYLCGIVQSGDRIAVTMGPTVFETINALQHYPRPMARGLGVVQAFGGLGDANSEEHVTVLTQRLGAWLRAEGYIMPAPAVVGSVAVRRALYRDRDISSVLDKARSATIAITGVGSVRAWPHRSPLGMIVRYPELARMPDLGAVGDINLRFFDKEGRPVRSDFDSRMVGLSLKELKSIRVVVGIAGGALKLAAIRGALKGGLINVLVTDNGTARCLAEE